jgi:hypothetical protein
MRSPEVEPSSGRVTRELLMLTRCSLERLMGMRGSICPVASTFAIDVYEKRKLVLRNLRPHVKMPVSKVDADTVSLPGSSILQNA